MRAVIDTNVWFRALISPESAPAKVYEAYRAGRFTVVTSLPLLKELEGVLSRPKLIQKYGYPPERALDMVTDLRRRAELVEITGRVLGCRDPKDDKFIETALLGRADYLVSVDKDLYDEPPLCEVLSQLGIHVMTVRSFAMELNLL